MAWFEDYFTRDWMRFRDADLMKSKALSEVDFLEDALGISPPARILDIGCGFGRHAIELACRGYTVTGLDLSADLLQEAEEAGEKRGASAEWLEMDMRKMDFVSQFDAAVCLYTSFGYFNDAENLDVLKRISRALTSGGRLVLDVENRDGLLLRYQSRDWYRTREGDIVLEDRRFDPVKGRQTTEMMLVGPDQSVSRTIDIRWYSVPELENILTDSGLQVEALYGALDGSAYDLSSWRLVIVARKS